MKRATPLLVAAAFAFVAYLGVNAARNALTPAAAFGWLGQAFRMSTRVTPSGPVVVERVQGLGRLETCRFNEQVVVHGQTGGVLPVWLAGDQLVFLGRGEVVAGIDLTRLQPGDVRVGRDEVTVRLPESEL